MLDTKKRIMRNDAESEKNTEKKEKPSAFPLRFSGRLCCAPVRRTEMTWCQAIKRC